MVRFSNVVIAYFLIGGIMWGGGVLAFADTGVVGVFVDDAASNGTVDTNEQLRNQSGRLGGPIGATAGSVGGGGGLVTAWNIVKLVVAYLFWPITVTMAVGAPTRVVVVAGGVMVVAFTMGLLRIIRGTV